MLYPPLSWDYNYFDGENTFANWYSNVELERLFPNDAGDIAQIYDHVGTLLNYGNNSGELQTVTNTSITIGGLELYVDNPTLYYDITVDHPSTEYYLFRQ